MKHYIIAKFNETVTDKNAAYEEIRAIYKDTASISGVNSFSIRQNCIDRANRYDVMICIDMAPEALPAWDASDIHKNWKERYGSLLSAKCIFDSID